MYELEDPGDLVCCVDALTHRAPDPWVPLAPHSCRPSARAAVQGVAVADGDLARAGG